MVSGRQELLWIINITKYELLLLQNMLVILEISRCKLIITIIIIITIIE